MGLVGEMSEKGMQLSSLALYQTEPVFLNGYGAQESKEWIPPAYVDWRAGKVTCKLFKEARESIPWNRFLGS